ncbi:WD40/YVTN/BNR-like repeat-containing protein [Clostridium tagluense]|uniref:WD40/YVTN/BNR-like repeat-containing protein n=1 Tax=Clostridium tagluense TaxID=360422 RepID=UPI001C6E9BA5|nr:hypothetical protein [Clostridium tagluense]MBW9159493.1 hypothetical protein [Clostridium tagluense]WLC68493.1 hypothetical protein KTC93_25605 [Clostridium tagluense]
MPGQNWAEGYHFTLSKQDNTVLLTVFSLEQEGYFTRTLFNATTKQLISGIHKVPKGGGLFKEDSGISWNVLKMKDTFYKNFFSDSYSTDNLIYATTPKGLIATKNNGNTWENILVSQSYILDIHTNKQKISINAEEGLYISLNKGVTWNKLNTPSKVSLANLDIDGNVYICSNDKILKESNKLWIDMKVPLSSGIIGFKLYNKTLIAYSSDSIQMLNMKTSKWEEIGKFNAIDNIFIT